MTAIRLRHIHRFTDRHGKVRCYLRVPGHKAVQLPGPQGSPEFMAAYHRAVQELAEARIERAPRAAPGTLNALATSYYACRQFKALRQSTRDNYRRIIERLCRAHGTKPIIRLDDTGVKKIMDERADHPAAANHLLRVLRLMMAHAVEQKLLPRDPTSGVERLKRTEKGYHTWSDAEIASYEDRWPTGSRPRLALALLLYTAQRRSDVVGMGRQHVRDNAIDVRQIKTGARLLIPIHPALAAELAHVPADRLTFLATEAGTAFTANGFYMRFREWCLAAGLPAGCSPHGLRKAAARRLAEAGATVHQIAAITGHKTLAEIERYTRAAEQARLAKAGMARIGNRIRKPVQKKFANLAES